MTVMFGQGASSSAAASSPQPDGRRWLALVVIAVAQLMVALDATIVNIALPSAQSSLGFDDSDRQWVVTAYTLSFGGLLLLGGRVADVMGHRRAFLGGLVGFAVASALAGAADGFALLIAGRALQGGFAAVLAPTALSMIGRTFTSPTERAKAFGVYGAVASSGGAVGLLLGGALTEYLDWRWCLYVNVVIAGGALVAGRAVLLSVPTHGPAGIDVVSGILGTGGLAAIVLGCSQAVPHGWGSVQVIGPLAVGVVALGLFLLRQARSASPMLPLGILVDRSRAGAYLAIASSVVGVFGMFLMLTYYLQTVLDYTPLEAGLAFLPLSVMVSLSAYGIASRLLPRISPRTLIVPGMLVAAAGLGLLSQLDPSSGYWTLMMPAQTLVGLGIGCVFTPAISLATSNIDPRDAGVAAAVANTSMQVGASIGTAVLNTVAITATTAYLAANATASEVDGLVHGYARATTWAALLLVGVAVLILLLVRAPGPATSAAGRAVRDRRSGGGDRSAPEGSGRRSAHVTRGSVDHVGWGSLRNGEAGRLLLPGDPGFDEARAGPFVPHDGETVPAAVLRCRCTADVVEAIDFARSHGVPLAVRSGGHCAAGLSSTTGLLVDLSAMDSVEMDGDRAVVGGGVRLAGLVAALAKHGQALPTGTCPTVGVAGLTLGGGWGILGRMFGLTCDHLLEAEVVTADGSVLVTDEDHAPELFWALRGGGTGGLVVVTSMVFRTVPAPRMTNFQYRWPTEAAAELVRAWLDWTGDAPVEMCAELGVSAGEANLHGAMVASEAETTAMLRPLCREAAPERTDLAELSYVSSTRYHAERLGELDPTAHLYSTSEFFDQPLPEDAVDALLERFATGPDVREIGLMPWGGAYGDLPPDATAFPHRNARYLVHHIASTSQASRPARAWVRGMRDIIHPYGTGGVYANFADPGLVDAERAYYGDNVRRLREVKLRYDPDNVFNTRQPPPAASSGPG
jgi:EmrB/QacA subfamily drug resistance transporter